MSQQKLTSTDWQAASRRAAQLAEDETFVRLVKQLRNAPTHHNHLWTEPDDFVIAVENCRRCQAFFSLPFTIVENL